MLRSLLTFAFASLASLSLSFTFAQTDGPPNILLIISDDLGVDHTRGYHSGGLMPTTPTLDSLRAAGITFENAWSAPVCSPTRGAIITGKHGIKTGILGVPGELTTEEVSLFEALDIETDNDYAKALVGKWHLSPMGNGNASAPLEHGVDFFDGVTGGGVGNYFMWNRSQGGMNSTETTYATTAFTDAARDWINQQEEQPWLMWLAHVAPHSPFHLPPDGLYSLNPVNNDQDNYVTMIEALDTEIGRLINSIPEEELDNTLIIYVGDNGTPNQRLKDYPNNHGKGSLYQGGIRVPLIISGAGVSRQGEREAALVMVADLFATILEVAGAELPGGRFNSLSFDHLFDNSEGSTRDYNYSDRDDGYAIRGPRYKLIERDGNQEFYDLELDSFETNDLLLAGLNSAQQIIKDDLEAEAQTIRSGWSCRDYIQNGDETGIDCGGSSCTPCITSVEAVGPAEVQIFPNPASNQVLIRSSGAAIEEVRILSLTGQELFRQLGINQQETRIELSSLPPQLYLLQLKTNNTVETVRLVKQ